MSKHTPGPWVHWADTNLVIRLHTGRPHAEDLRICEVSTNTRRDEGRHNARLIASAPAMLEALEAMLEVHGVRWEHVRGDSSIPASWVELSDKARAAIKAAKGEA